MPEYLTFLLTELSPRGRRAGEEPVGAAPSDDPARPASGAAAGDAARDMARDAVHDTLQAAISSLGGAVVVPPHLPGAATSSGGGAGSADGDRIVAAVFQLGGDAARAAMEIARTLAGDRSRSFRMALCTGEAHAQGATLGGPALDRATELLRLAGPREVLVTASTAVAASPTLPRSAELIDRGARTLGRGIPPERVYVLGARRAGDLGPADDPGGPRRPAEPGDPVSNLDWARRAVFGPVLGREEPLAALESAWKRTLTGDPRMVLLVGDGGIGKTTLAAELALRLHADGALVLYGRWDQGSLAPYQAVREALGTYANGCPPGRLRLELEGRSDEIARVLPDVVARTGGVRVPLRGDATGERLRLFEAIGGWLDLLAGRRPVLLVLDDLHWAGRSSLQLVEHLRQRRGSAPLMTVITMREGETPTGDDHTDVAALLARVTAEGQGVERIGLRGLDPTVIVRLIEQAIGRSVGPHDADVVEWLTQDTAGNPLFVQQVLRSVIGRGDAGAALKAARQRLPEQLADVVEWRLAQLPGRTVEVLADAALVGGSFEVDLLGAVTGTAPVVLVSPLETAAQAGLLLRTQPERRYAFAHEVVRRVLRRRLDRDRAAALHRRIAAALSDRAREGADVSTVEVADHYLRGADPGTARQAIRWARQAAEAARRETAFESAVNLLARAVEVHDRFRVDGWFGGPGAGAGGGPVDTHESHAVLACELRLELAEAHDRAGEFTARDRRHLEAADLARELDDTELFTRAALGFRGHLPAATPPDPEARQLLEEALHRLPPDPSRSRALVLARLAQVRHFDAPYELRRSLSDEAVAMARELDNPVVLATALVARGLTLDGPEDVDEQLGLGTEITRIGERTGDPELMLQGARVSTPALLVLGRHEQARAQAETLTSLAQQVRHPDQLRLATMWEILWSMLEGRYDEADDLVARLRNQLVVSGHSQSRSIQVLQRFPKVWLRGLDQGRPQARTLPVTGLTPTSAWAISTWMEALAGHEEQALARLADQDPSTFVDSLPHDFLWWPTVIVLALTASCGGGDPAWATVLHDTLAPFEGRHCFMGFSAYAGAVDHHLGTLALVLDQRDRAIELLTSGLDQHREIGAEPFVALSARWLAHALSGSEAPDAPERSAMLHAESQELADRLGLRGLPAFDGQLL